MKQLFQIIRNNKIWSGITGLLFVIGGAAYTPAVELGKEAAQTSVETYCEANPSEEECNGE